MPQEIHDMGGEHRFYGAIARENDEPVFHERWEGRVFGMAILSGATVSRNIDSFRDSIERTDPERYLEGYWGRWLAALEDQLVKRGYLAAGEVDARLEGKKTEAPRTRKPPVVLMVVMTSLVRRVMRPMPRWLLRLYPRVQGHGRRVRRLPAFRTGDGIIVCKERPDGHTRVPGYACGRRGIVSAIHGAMVFPDAHTKKPFKERPQYLYTVAFDAHELWSNAEPGVVVHVDLFEPYLEVNP